MATKEPRLCVQLHQRHQDDLAVIQNLGARLIGPSFKSLSRPAVVKWLIAEKRREWQVEVDRVFAARIEADQIIDGLEHGDPESGKSV